MQISGMTDVGLLRQQNQDALFYEQVDGSTSFAVVCDGMGGAAAGNVASARAIESFVASVKLSLDARLEAALALEQGVAEANAAVCTMAQSDERYAGMGTTLVAALVTDGQAHIVNVGDSRAYHLTTDGARRITRDHSLVEDLVERGEITPDEARVHPQRNLITRALGVEPRVEADLFSLRVTQGDALLLCSDGLSNLVTAEELHERHLQAQSAQDCCQALVSLARERGAPDNVTVILLIEEGGGA